MRLVTFSDNGEWKVSMTPGQIFYRSIHLNYRARLGWDKMKPSNRKQWEIGAQRLLNAGWALPTLIVQANEVDAIAAAEEKRAKDFALIYGSDTPRGDYSIGQAGV